MAKKRFTLTNRSLSEIGNDTAIADDGVPCTQRFVCNLLNELIEENEQLKSRVDYLERKIQRERMSYQKQHEKWENETITENEKIKQQRDFYYARLQKIIKVANGDFE